ncbi:MAG: hypothetical protein AVDCRST_MAG19-3266, partial [uncultured Thermomicrobiales bacterium]
AAGRRGDGRRGDRRRRRHRRDERRDGGRRAGRPAGRVPAPADRPGGAGRRRPARAGGRDAGRAGGRRPRGLRHGRRRPLRGAAPPPAAADRPRPPRGRLRLPGLGAQLPGVDPGAGHHAAPRARPARPAGGDAARPLGLRVGARRRPGTAVAARPPGRRAL